MQTVQLQCGSCQKLMAIAEAHLGGQVQCPHCKAVVQTVRPTPPAPPPPPSAYEAIPSLQIPERDSIFGAPEQRDDLFDEPADGPLVEMPAPTPVTPPSAAPGFSDAPAEHAPAPTDNGPADDDDLQQLGRREIPRPSLAPITALIFLIPYALLATAFIVYLLMTQNRSHPFDVLPDRDKKGAARVQVQHDLELGAHQKVALGQTHQVGDLEVTPRHVFFTPEGNLALSLHVKNVSDKWTFNPLSDAYLKFNSDQTYGMPYTFIQPHHTRRIYGGYAEWLKGTPPKRTDEGDLRPGQEEIIRLITPDSNDNLALVKAIIKNADPCLWRVQVRRGPVSYRGDMVSATTVIGVPFRAKDIQKEAGDT